jgi:hypothetical protein
MLALIFMSVGGSLPFVGKGVLSRRRLVPSIALTILGSGLGAFLLLSVPLKALQITIAVAMIGVAIFSLLSKNFGQAGHEPPASNVAVIVGYAVTFLLAIYGGFFSGGYVTMLTAAFVLLFGMTPGGCGYYKSHQPVLFRGGNTGIHLARCCGFEARHHPWCFYVFGGSALRPHRPVPQYSLAAADINCRGSWPCGQDAIALVLGKARSSRNTRTPVTMSCCRLCPRYDDPRSGSEEIHESLLALRDLLS